MIALPRRPLAAARLLGLVAALAPGLAAAQSVRFDHLGVEQGLSAGWVKAVLKDSRGFLWFGTVDGLDRYDGASFRRYSLHSTRADRLPMGRVEALLEDRERRLWVGGNGGLALYDRMHDRFSLSARVARPDNVSNDDVLALLEDKQGRLWVGTQGGLDALDPVRGRFRTYRHDAADPASLVSDRVQCLFEDRQGRIWVGTSGGLDRFDPDTGRFTHVPQQPTADGLRLPADVADLYQDAQGNLWVGTLGGGLQRLDPDLGRVVDPYPGGADDPSMKSHARVRRLAGGPRGTLYVGTEGGGLEVHDLATGRFTRYLPDIEDETSLSSNSIYALLVDNQNILWVGTYGNGLNVVTPQGQYFRLLRAHHGKLNDPHVTAVLEDRQGDLWVATDGGGLNQIEKDGRFVYHLADPTLPGRLRSNAVVGLFEDSRGNLWVGSFLGGLARYDPVRKTFVSYLHDPADPSSIVSNSVWTILEDPNGELLVSTNEGVDVFDPRRGRFSRLAARFPAVRQGRLHVMVKDSTGGLWLGGWDATQYLDRKTGQVTQYLNDPADPNSIAPGNLYDAYPDSRGNVWLATEGGLSCIEAGTRRMRRFTEADGLPHVKVTAIVEDETGDLWLGTFRGISRMVQGVQAPAKPRFVNFDVFDGLQGPEFRRRAKFRSPRGEIFFGGQQGLTSFFPKLLLPNTDVPPVVLTDLQVFNRSALPGEAGSPLQSTITETTDLTLSHRDAVVSFEFAALNYMAPQKNQYAYRLEGFDPEWNVVGKRRRATYTNLPPGHYVLRVRGSNNDGVWNQEGVAVRLRVTPPFWATWWFGALCVGAALAAALTAHRARVRQHERVERELEARVRDGLARIQTLSGLLPICAWCKRVREDDGYWKQLETFVSEHSQAEFTHGICPTCAREQMAEAVRSR